MNRLSSNSTKLHGKRQSLKSLPFDLKIFKEPKSECTRSPNHLPITERCAFTQRLCAASSYLDHIQKSTTLSADDKKQLFVEFNEDVYRSVTDDVAHFVKEHEDDIKRVHSEWTQRYGFPKCSVSECAQTARHYGRESNDGNKEKESEEEDALHSFYESLYDRFHHYLFHLYDVGLRVDAASLTLNKEGDDEKDTESEGVAVDQLFVAERDHIKSRREELKMDSQRMSPQNTKFMIQTMKEQTGVTLTDALFEDLTEKDKMENKRLQRIQGFLKQNAFDSDAMQIDLEETSDSNICGVIQNQETVKMMKNFIESIKLRRAAFSTGFQFHYEWENHEMFVKPKYKNLKEEIIESGYLTLSQWMEFVDLKGNKYWKSETVKKMKKDGENEESWRKRDLTLEHLFAVILYCDFTKLCTAFSGTFRRENVFESVESVISRHSEYAIFGRLLVEMVNRFGINRYKGNGAQQKESGPFYCGINRVLNVGSFAIKLKGPNSTTTVKAVALNFAKSDGLLLKLNNDIGDAKRQRFLDTSWISAYFEEAERLFIGGNEDYALRLVSIVLIRRAKSYLKALRALYYFDAMISGVRVDLLSDETDYELISNLMNWTLNGDDIGHSETDWFIKNEWNLFLQKKKSINLELHFINNYFRFLSKLVVFKVVRTGLLEYYNANGKDNVVRPECISMFPSLDTLDIDTSTGSHKFRLESLLDSMQSISPSITVNVKDYGSWIEDELTDDIYTAFDAAGWNIEYEKDGYSGRSNKLVIKSKGH